MVSSNSYRKAFSGYEKRRSGRIQAPSRAAIAQPGAVILGQIPDRRREEDFGGYFIIDEYTKVRPALVLDIAMDSECNKITTLVPITTREPPKEYRDRYVELTKHLSIYRCENGTKIFVNETAIMGVPIDCCLVFQNRVRVVGRVEENYFRKDFPRYFKFAEKIPVIPNDIKRLQKIPTNPESHPEGDYAYRRQANKGQIVHYEFN